MNRTDQGRKMKKRLLVLDVEGTIFERFRIQDAVIDSTIWQGIAKALGDDAVREELQTQKGWQTGGYRTYIEWMRSTVSIHIKYGLTKDIFQDLIKSAKYNPHVPETIMEVDRGIYVPILVSGGFRELAARAQRDFNIEHAFAACEYFFGEDNKLETYNLLPCDFQGKIEFVRMMLKEYDLDSNDWVFVGDGKNDVPVAKAAAVSVGYRPDPGLRKVVTYRIEDFKELLAILRK